MNDKVNIYLARKSEYRDSLRKYKVFIDGINVGVIGNGQNLKLSVDPGEHNICLKVDWVGSNTLMLNARSNEDIYLECGSNIKLNLNPETYIKWLASATILRDTNLYIKRI